MNGTIQPPVIEYALLSPMLLVFGAAIIGVLVEAFAPRYLRKSIHMPLTLLALLGAFLMTVLNAVNGLPDAPAAMGSVAVDGPSLFIWGIILVLALVSTLLINDEEQFVAQAAAVPGSPDEEEAILSGYAQTEVYPLLLFSVGGMLLFASANDLLIMFVGLEVMSLPLYLLCDLAADAACSRRRRRSSTSCSARSPRPSSCTGWP